MLEIFLVFLLQEVSQGVSDDQSSISILAGGLESFSQSLSDFSYEIDETLTDIQSHIYSLNTMDIRIAISILNSDIYKLQSQLNTAYSNIQSIQNSLDSGTACSVISSCKDCVDIHGCVWCDSTSACTDGDEDGPFSLVCRDYSYNKCPSQDCDKYSTCNTCIYDPKCGWCSNSNKCIKGTSYDSGSCLTPFYYHSQADGRKNCPAAKSSDNKVGNKKKVTYTFDQYTEDLEDQLEDQMQLADEIYDLIKQLKIYQSEIKQSLNLTSSLSIDSVGFDSIIEGLSQDVESLAQNELRAKQDFEDNLGFTASNDISAAANSITSNSTEVLNNELEIQDTNLYNQINQADKNFNAQFNKMKKDASDIDASLGT
jgi:Plexin repeat